MIILQFPTTYSSWLTCFAVSTWVGNYSLILSSNFYFYFYYYFFLSSGKSNLGGSPKLAVRSIEGMVNVKEKGNDYLGESRKCLIFQKNELCYFPLENLVFLQQTEPLYCITTAQLRTHYWQSSTYDCNGAWPLWSYLMRIRKWVGHMTRLNFMTFFAAVVKQMPWSLCKSCGS